MADANVPPGAAANWALAALPPGDFRKLVAGLEPVALTVGDVLFEAGEPIRFFYFPCGGLASVLTPLDGGKVAEVAVVGREGVVGLPILLGADASPHRAVVQAPGPALRIKAEAFRRMVGRSRALLSVLLLYADAFLVQVSLSAVCNCLHPVPKRYCRWLLMAHDRVGSDHLPFTQKFLALVLTVRLASVSEANAALERDGLVRYRRGELHILDRPGLEAACCGCYQRIQAYFARLPG